MMNTLHSEKLTSTHLEAPSAWDGAPLMSWTRLSEVAQRRPSAPTVFNRLARFSFLFVFKAIDCLIPPYFIKLLNFQLYRGALHSSGHSSELRGINDRVFDATRQKIRNTIATYFVTFLKQNSNFTSKILSCLTTRFSLFFDEWILLIITR